MPCRTSTALRTTTGLILEFFLRALFGPDRPMARFYTSAGLSAGLNLSLAMIQEDYGVAASVGQSYCPLNLGKLNAPCASRTKP